MVRRDFLKSSCSLCLAVGSGMVWGSISSCSSVAVYKTEVAEKKIKVPVNLFVQSDLQLIRTKQLDYDIALRKESSTEYIALLMSCTHAENQVRENGNGFSCNLHGSIFDKTGAVTKGPAQFPLKKYKTEITSDNIIIYL